MVEITLSIMLQIVQTVGILVGIVYYLIIMRNSQRNQELARKAQEQAVETRQAQLFMNVYNTLASKEFQKDWEQMMHSDYDDFMAKYGLDANPDYWAVFAMGSTWIEGIGVLVRRGLIDPELVYDLMYGSIILFWERHLVILQSIREQLDLPLVWADLEYIYNMMKSIQEKRHS
jgi:hypothetical protein